MKQIVLTCMIILWGMTVKSQEKMSYQLKGQLIEFSISQNEIYIRFDKDQKVVIEKQFRQNFIGLNANSALIAVKNLTGSFRQKKQILQDNIPIKFKKVEPVLIYEDGIREIATGELNIKVKQNGSLDKILKGVKYSSQQNQFDEKLYLIKTDLSTSELFRLVNRLQSSDQAEFIEPNFIRLIKPYTNDQFYSYQWSINNQGYLGGTVDADMDVDGAWAYSNGSGIKVAVIDEGVDLTHPDLTPNLLTGYDATGNGSNGAPNEGNNDAHGTACSGIIAAVANNNDGIAGIAYGAKILPVRIAYSNGFPLGSQYRNWVSNDNWTANGINWAVTQGADILSCSWGGEGEAHHQLLLMRLTML